MSAREDQLLDDRHGELMKAIAGIHTRLDLLNGRTRKNEVAISVLQWAYTVLAGFALWLLKG